MPRISAHRRLRSVELMEEGKSIREIGRALNISPAGVAKIAKKARQHATVADFTKNWTAQKANTSSTTAYCNFIKKIPNIQLENFRQCAISQIKYRWTL